MLRSFTIAALSALLTAAAPPLQPPGKSCYVDGFETPMRCVTITVPLDYDAPTAGTIEVTAAIAPATRPAPDPLFVFAGGPGQAATAMGPWLTSAFAPARRQRDIVLFDIRGTGMSSPMTCQMSSVSDSNSEATLRKDAAACAAKNVGRTAFFSSRELVEDVDRMRKALGYAKINLWGGSFGTRLAQHYIRAHGTHVRTAILDAATPVNSSIFATAPRYGQAALERLYRDCGADKACATAFPNLEADYDKVLHRAAQTPKWIEATDPRTGLKSRSLVDLDTTVGFVRGALYVGFSRSVLPYAITQAAQEDHSSLMALGSATNEWSLDTMSLGSMLGVICSEDHIKAKKADPASLSFGFMRDSYFRLFSAACEEWPHRPLPTEMFAPFTSSVPAMAISGELDPVTPIESGEATLSNFTNRTHIVIANGFHTNSATKCVSDLIGEFLNDPITGARDQSCVAKIKQPRFLLSPTL